MIFFKRRLIHRIAHDVQSIIDRQATIIKNMCDLAERVANLDIDFKELKHKDDPEKLKEIEDARAELKVIENVRKELMKGMLSHFEDLKGEQ